MGFSDQWNKVVGRSVTTTKLVPTQGSAPKGVPTTGVYHGGVTKTTLSPTNGGTAGVYHGGVTKTNLATTSGGTNGHESPGVTITPLERKGEHNRVDDHWGDFNFVLEIDGLNAGRFQKCDGLSVEFDLIEWRDSMDPYPKKRPGMKKFGSIKLTKGYTPNSKLWDWCKELMDGSVSRKTGAIHLIADDGQTYVSTYRFIDAWPMKWTSFRLDGKGNGAMVEEVELAVEYVMRG